MNYWKEALECALDEAGCFNALTKEQIEFVAKSLHFAAQMESEATGRLCIPNPLVLENKELAKKLETERRKVHCKECGGCGTITVNFGFRSSTSRCSKCNGEGRHL